MLGLYISMPSFIYLSSEPKVRRDKVALKKAIPDYYSENRVSLGIDLQGGLHLVMGVDTEKAVLNRADRVGDEIAEAMKEKGKPTESVRRPAETPIVRISMIFRLPESSMKIGASERTPIASESFSKSLSGPSLLSFPVRRRHRSTPACAASMRSIS